MVCELYLTQSIQLSVGCKSELWQTDTLLSANKIKVLLLNDSLTNASTQNSAQHLVNSKCLLNQITTAQIKGKKHEKLALAELKEVLKLDHDLRKAIHFNHIEERPFF